MTTPPVAAPQKIRRRNRIIAAVTTLLAWGAGVGMLVDREYFRERSAVLAEAAMRLGPSTSFYVVEQDGKQIGFASTTIDTSTTTFEVVDYFIADLPLGDQIFRASARSVITLSRALALRSFDVQFESADAPMSVTGEAEGDSVVSFILQLPLQPADSQRIRVGGPILLPTLIPAAALLVSDPKVGSTVTLATFDPRTMTTQNVKLRFEAESLFTLVDDGTILDGPGACPFDDEGVPSGRTELFTAGVLNGFLHNAYTASRAGGGQRSTGNGKRGYTGPPSVAPSNFYVDRGQTSFAELLARADGGVLIMDVSGVHSGANPISGEFSVGATGVRIRGGELAEPLREMTIASTLPEMLAGVSGVGEDLRFFSSVGTPSLLFGEMSLAGV